MMDSTSSWRAWMTAMGAGCLKVVYRTAGNSTCRSSARAGRAASARQHSRTLFDTAQLLMFEDSATRAVDDEVGALPYQGVRHVTGEADRRRGLYSVSCSAGTRPHSTEISSA